MYRFLALGPYEGSHKDIAKRVKTLDPEAMMLAAAAIRNIIPGNAVLIPMPSHTGEPTFSLPLCRITASMSRTPMLDCLRGNIRESLCETKNREFLQGAPKGSLLPCPEELGIRLTTGVPQGRRPVIIDNVVASGTTAVAALRLFGPEALLIAIACDETFPKIPGLVDCKQEVLLENLDRHR